MDNMWKGRSAMMINEWVEWKKKRGYTYAQISKLSGVPLGTVQKIFTGVTENPRYETLLALNAFFLNDIAGEKKGDGGVSDSAYNGACMVCDSAQGFYGERPEKYPVEDMVHESEPAYWAKRQGEYTVEDYWALPDDHRVELIDGCFYDMAAPASVHQMIGGEIYRQIANYIIDKGGSCTPFISPVDVQLDNDEKTMVQPDVFIVCKRDQIVWRNVMGAPDFVVEIVSPGSRRKDYVLKMEKYRNAGVQEYWLVDMKQKVVLVYFFENEACPTIYPLRGEIPVNIYGGDLVIQFDRMAAWIEEMEGE